MDKKIIRCKTKYCRNTIADCFGVHEPDGWLCEECWDKQCAVEREKYETIAKQ